jgi:hypothetical protein
MALTQTQVSQLYVAIFNRASEGSGNAYWQTQSDMAAAATAMLATTDAESYFGDSLDSDQAFIEHIYLNTLNKTAEDDADGIAYWVGRLEAGATRGEVVAELVQVIESYGPDGENYDPEDAATVAAYNQFMNRVEVSNYMADNVTNPPADYAQSTAFDQDLVVTDDPATVTTAQAAIDALADDDDPGVEGEDYFLTADQDVIDGTVDDDMFYADVVQVGGPQVNSLATGDRLDGDAGTDMLEAQITEGLFMGGTNMPIQPRTTDIEDVRLEALNADMNAANSEVYLSAKDMFGVDEIWSWYSDANLTVQDMNTMTDAGDHDIARNTSEMTVGMGYTGSADGIWDESDMHVLFDPDFLLTGQQAESKAIYYLLDQDADLFDTDVDGDGTVDLLANINANGLRFTVDGVEQVIEFDQTLLTDGSILNHDDFVAALQDSLDALIAAGAVPEDTVLYVDDTMTDFTFLDDGSRSSDIPAIVLETQTSTILDSVGFAWVEDLVGEYNVYGRLDDESGVEEEPLSVQVDLEKVGRGADGGELLVGSMDKFNEGIDEFYVTVYGDDSRPSSLSRLDSTGNDLDRIYITSDNDGFPTDTFADLTIGNANTVGNPHPFNGTPGPVNDGMSLIESNGFGGDLSLGTATNRVNDLAELDTTDMAGNTTFWAEIDALDPVATALAGVDVFRSVQYDYQTGSGDDVVSLILDGDAVDTVGEGLAIATNAGEDMVTVDAPVGEGSPFQLGVSQNTMQYLSNLAVATGAGEDAVVINDNFRFMVEAGADSDFVYINSQDEDFDAFDGETGAWVFSTATGAPTFVNRVLYQAELTVNFAGFESTVTVQTTAANNFVATQLDINEAFMAAIDASPELSRMLAYTGGTGSQQLTITSLVDGANTLAVDLYQPQLVAAGNDTVAGEVNLAAADEDALLAGIVATDAAEDSDTDPLAYMNANDGSLDADGTVGTGGPLAAPAYDFQGAAIGGSFDAIGVRNVNFSVINMGAGANDLVVLDSNDNSANILVIDQTFGKVSVVNFFDDAARTVVGNHAIDFTAYLNNVDSNTGSTLSEDPIAITLNVTPITAPGSVAAANSVNMLRLAGAGGETFAALTAEDLITALNGDGTADDNYANITNATLDAAANTVDLVGRVQDHIVMVENAANLGEYKVFYLTSTVDADTDTTDGEFDTGGTLLGTLDFGASINFNLVGSAGWTALYNELIDTADDIEVVDDIAPTLDDTDPADGATDVAVDTDIVLTFDEDVQAGTGNISVFSAGELVEAVPVGNAVFDGNTVTVDLTADLEPGTTYYVRVPATAIQDLAGNAFAGITNPLDFNFTTAGEAPPAENVVDMAASEAYTATDGVVDVFQYEVDSTTGRAVGTDGEVFITGFNVAEDRLEFVDAGDQMTTANFETFPGVSLAENPFADNTTIAFDPDEGVASLITVVGIQDAALDTIDYAVA